MDYLWFFDRILFGAREPLVLINSIIFIMLNFFFGVPQKKVWVWNNMKVRKQSMNFNVGWQSLGQDSHKKTIWDDQRDGVLNTHWPYRHGIQRAWQKTEYTIILNTKPYPLEQTCWMYLNSLYCNLFGLYTVSLILWLVWSHEHKESLIIAVEQSFGASTLC